MTEVCQTKELSFCHKLKSSDSNIFAILWCKPLIFQTKIILSISINSLKYLRSTTLGYKDIEIKKSEFVAKTQLLSIYFISHRIAITEAEDI